MIERKFPEPGSERRLQGSSSASPAKEKRSAGDKKRDRKWRDYQESLAAEAAQGAKGGTPAPSPQRANCGHHPGHATLGDFMAVATQTRAKARPLLLRPQQAPAGPSSDVESAHRGRMPADQASSSSSAAPTQRDVARACDRVCWVPCNLRVARQRATQRNAAVEGAVGIAHEEATEWGRGMDYHASKVAAIAAGLTAAAAHEAVAARIRATDEEARRTQEAIACKEAEVKALEEALAQERAKKEAEERAHVEATAKAQEDAAKKRDRKWRDYQESLAAEAAQGAKGGTPAPSPQRANCGHHPGHATLGDFMAVATQTRAKARPLLLRPQQAPAGPSSDVESAHRGRMPADQASSSSSAAPAQRDVARACERVCWVPCNLRVARQRATQRNAAVEGAVGIAHEEATEWGRGMDYHASKVAAIAAGLTAAAAHEAVAARIRATDEEARRTQEAIACKEAEVKALEEALAQERAKKEAEERAHVEATAKAQEDAAKKEAIEAARRKVAEEKAETEAELAALEAQKAQLQQAREPEAARAREEAKVRAAAATAAAMEEAEAKLRRETPPGGSRVETLRKLFEGDASSRMTLDEADTGSSGSSGHTARRRRKGKGKTPERPRRPAGGHPHDSDPFFTASDGDERGRRHRQVVAWTGGGGGDVPMEPEGEDEDLPPPYRSSESSVTECKCG